MYMFIQYRPWKDCDRHCSFCYLTEGRGMSLDEKRKSLMKLSCILHYTSQGFDDIGLIGGELFTDDSLFHEWVCVAESIHNADHIKRVYLGTHLLGDVDMLLDFADMLGKEVQICTSYDSKGRFFKDDYEMWCKNVKKVQDAGYKVVCSATLTDALVHDTQFTPPEGVEFKIQPIFFTEEWLEDISKWCHDGEEYNANLRLKMKEGALVKRGDFLKYLNEHKDIAKEYSEYNGKHATVFHDFIKGEYVQQPFVCSNNLAPCGHPLIAYCYADSYRCTMCDAKELGQ